MANYISITFNIRSKSHILVKTQKHDKKVIFFVIQNTEMPANNVINFTPCGIYLYSLTFRFLQTLYTMYVIKVVFGFLTINYAFFSNILLSFMFILQTIVYKDQVLFLKITN